MGGVKGRRDGTVGKGMWVRRKEGKEERDKVGETEGER